MRRRGRLGWTSRDADVEIEARAGKAISRIFTEDGEPAFRALERDIADCLSDKPDIVVALGGGAMADPLTRERLLSRGLVAWLQVSPAVAAERLRQGLAREPRPMLGTDPEHRLAAMIEARESAYAQAHIHVSTDIRTVGEVADELGATVRAKPDRKAE